MHRRLILISILLSFSVSGAAQYTYLPIAHTVYQPYAQDIRLAQSHAIWDGERHMVVVSCGYNNQSYVKWYLDSLISQQYSNFHILYVDDCSTDGTVQELQRYAYEQGLGDKLILLSNTERRKALANLYFAIHLCKDSDIIVIVDGDDALAFPNVLSYLNSVYADSNVWITYGQFREYPSGALGFCRDYDEEVIKNNGFRYVRRAPSHLRTFYAGLFKKIQVDDLMFKGEFFSMCYDLAIMFPMLEMAHTHYTFISKILLEYNTINPLNDHKVSKQLQVLCDAIIRARTCYRPLSQLFINK